MAFQEQAFKLLDFGKREARDLRKAEPTITYASFVSSCSRPWSCTSIGQWDEALGDNCPFLVVYLVLAQDDRCRSAKAAILEHF